MFYLRSSDWFQVGGALLVQRDAVSFHKPIRILPMKPYPHGPEADRLAVLKSVKLLIIKFSPKTFTLIVACSVLKIYADI